MKTDLLRLTSPKDNVVGQALRYCSVMAIIYIILILALPANQASMRAYHLTAVEYHILLFMIRLPIVAIWYVAFFGVAKLRDYAWFIHKTREGKSLWQIARGTNWIAWGLPLNATLALILFSLAGSHPAFRPTATIINNYTQMLVPLIGFSIMAQGSITLTHDGIGQRAGRAKILILSLVSLGVIFCYFTFRQFSLSAVNSTSNPYFMPAWLMIITLLIPFLYAWFTGLLAAYEIGSYGHYLKGVLFRQPFILLASGLVTVIISSIALQYSRSLDPYRGVLSLNYHLLLNFLFSIAIGVGFCLITLGAIRLKKIEDL